MIGQIYALPWRSPNPLLVSRVRKRFRSRKETCVTKQSAVLQTVLLESPARELPDLASRSPNGLRELIMLTPRHKGVARSPRRRLFCPQRASYG